MAQEGNLFVVQALQANSQIMSAVSLNRPPRRILVIYVSRIGDTMLITPAVRAMAKAWSGATIDFLGSPKSADVFRHLPFVSQVLSTTKARIRLKGWLVARKYDLAVVYGYDGDGPFVEYALRVAAQVVAFKQKNSRLNERLLTAVEKPPFQSCHAVDHFLSLIQPFGIPLSGRRLSYVVSQDEQLWAEATLARIRGSRRSHPLVVFQISSFPTKAYRDWPVEQFLALAREILLSWPDAHFLVIGGNLELARTTWLAAQLRDHSTHLAGTLTLRETAALMNEMDVFVGVDTGPTHIMGALNQPMVVLYHGFSPSWFLAPIDRPCFWAIDHPNAGQVGPEATMSDITVERVFETVKAALEFRKLP